MPSPSPTTDVLLHALQALSESEKRDFTALYSGADYDPRAGLLTCGVWAPARTPRTLALELLIPQGRGIYRKEHHLFARRHDFHVLAVDGIQPFEAIDKGMLYRFFDCTDRSAVPDIYSYYQPFGTGGPSAIVDQTYSWPAGPSARCPTSITKLHVGTATSEGTFNGLARELDASPLLSASDGIEFLPIGAFPGRPGWRLTETRTTLALERRSDELAVNWGYDGGPNFPVSVSASYGQPRELKMLVDMIRQRNIAVGFDIQLNHYGPEDIFQPWYGPYLSGETTEWGEKPDFAHPQVRALLLAKLRLFCRLYRPDYVRLDMSSRYGDDAFIREIQQALPIAVILEDERDHPWLTHPQGARCRARWDFDTVHDLERIRQGHFQELPRTLERITAHSFHSVVFAGSHDEQGNNLGLAPSDKLTPALAAMTNGIEMSWYSFGFFHFFCNYQDENLLVRVTAEKSGCLIHLPQEFWPQLAPLHRYFAGYQDCRDFFLFIHGLWKDEVQPVLGSHKHQARQAVQVWIRNNPDLIPICRAYNDAIYNLSNIRNGYLSQDYRSFVTRLKKLRRSHPWLTTDRPQGSWSYFPESKKIVVRRVGPDGNTVTLEATGHDLVDIGDS